MTEKYTLTDEHRAQLKPWAEKWTANALRIERMNETDREAMRAAVKGLYESVDLAPPERIVFAEGPVTGAIATGLAAGIWYLRGDPKAFEFEATEDMVLAEAYRVAKVLVMRKPNGAEILTRVLKVLAEAIGTESELPAIQSHNRQATDKEKTLNKFLRACVSRWHNMRNGGNQWSGWVAFLSFFRHVVQLDVDYSKWHYYEEAAIHGGPRYMHEKFCIISDFPTTISMDEQKRPHAENGPAIAWNDGYDAYYWHGTKVDRRVVMEPESYTKEEMQELDNSEVVRALLERLGTEKFLERMEIEVVDRWADPKTGLTYELLDLTNRLGEDQPKWLRMQSPALHDGTQPYFIEAVHPDLMTAKAARRWQIPKSSHEAARYYRHGDVVVLYAPQDTIEWPTPDECNEYPELEFVTEA